jgi:glycosyltransferase involved in cell wall biosynthesis
MPNYNHCSFLKERVDSILNQTYKDFELIILDDCSTDNSKEIIEQYRNHSQIINIIYNRLNSGNTFFQWNKGIQLAKGDYIWFAESDDYADPDFLEKVVPLFESGDNIGLVFCNSLLVDANGTIRGNTSNWTEEYAQMQDAAKTTLFNGYRFCQEHLFLLNRIPNASAVLFRNELVKNNPDWIDSTLKNSGDWKLWLNIALTSNVVWLNEDLNYFRIHDKNVTSSLPLLKSEAIKIIKELLAKKKYSRVYRIYEGLAFWSFNSAAWTNDPVYSAKNFMLYLRNNTTFFSVYFLLYYLLKRSFINNQAV